jgi:Tol biopolymer transport system component
MPVWSPDGKWIALRTIRADGTSLLDVISIGGRRRRILARGAIVVPEAWSPTGDAVLFMRSSSSSLDATRRLYIVRLDGARARPVAYTDGATIGASWHR